MRIGIAIAAGLALGLAIGAQGQSVIGDLASVDANVKGAVSLTSSGTRLMSGSQVIAGQSRASLRLERGGTLDICPRTSLSVTSSAKGGELMLALGDGAIETHYDLGGVADTIITPDFRILLAGPGKFHFAISTDLRGDTCVRSLPGNAASVIVYEQMGQGMYQVSPGGQALFHDGTVQNSEMLMPPNCGCPQPRAPRVASQAKPNEPLAPDAGKSAVASDNVQVQVDAPFVFRGDEPRVSPPPMVAQLEARTVPPVLLRVRALPPPKPVKPAKAAKPAKVEPAAKKAEESKPKGFFARIMGWFRSADEPAQ